MRVFKKSTFSTLIDNSRKGGFKEGYESGRNDGVRTTREEAISLLLGHSLLVHGSVLKPDNKPNDLDLITTSPTYLVGSADFAFRALLRNWIDKHPKAKNLPFDVSKIPQLDEGKVNVYVPWGTAGRPGNYEIIHLANGHKIIEREVNGVASALRGDIVHDGAFEDWVSLQEERREQIRISLGRLSSGWIDPSYSCWPADYFFIEQGTIESLRSVKKAMLRHPHGRELVKGLPDGDKLYDLVMRGDLDRGFWEDRHRPENHIVLDFDKGMIGDSTGITDGKLTDDSFFLKGPERIRFPAWQAQLDKLD